MKLTCLLLAAIFCNGLGLGAEPPEIEDELAERTLDELGNMFHEGLLQLLPHHPKQNLKPLRQLYYLIQVITAYRHSPVHHHTPLDRLIHDLVDPEFQRQLRYTIRKLHKLENIGALENHPSIAENPHDKDSYVNDVRRLLPAIHRALGAIRLDLLQDPGLRTKLIVLRQKCVALTTEVVHTEYALLTVLAGVPPEYAVHLQGREEEEVAEDRHLLKPGHGHGAGLHHLLKPGHGAGLHHHQLPHHHRHKPGHGSHHNHGHKPHHKNWHVTKLLREKMANFNRIMHDKKALMAAIMRKKKKVIKDLLDRRVDLQTLIDDIVQNLNEQRQILTEIMSKNGEVFSEVMQDNQKFFAALGTYLEGPITDMVNKVTEPISYVVQKKKDLLEGIVDATKGVVEDALYEKEKLLKKVLHKPTHKHPAHHSHHGSTHSKNIVKQILDTQKQAITNVIKKPWEILKPEEDVGHFTDIQHKVPHHPDVQHKLPHHAELEDRYEYENERYEFKPEYYESQDPEEPASGRQLDAGEEIQNSEELQSLEKKAGSQWDSDGPEARLIDNDNEVTLNYWTPAPVGKTTAEVRPVYAEDLEAATAQSEPLWAEGRSDDHEELKHELDVSDEDYPERKKEFEAGIDLEGLYLVSTKVLYIVQMLEDGAGFDGLNDNISSNDMALIVNRLAQQENDKLEDARGVTQVDLYDALKWLIEYKEVPKAEQILEVLELWKQAEILQVKANGNDPEKFYLVRPTDGPEDDWEVEDDEEEEDDEWGEAPVPEDDDGMKPGDYKIPGVDVIKPTEGLTPVVTSRDGRSQPFPEEDPDLTEPLEEQTPVDQETKRIQPFPEERPDETEPLEVA